MWRKFSRWLYTFTTWEKAEPRLIAKRMPRGWWRVDALPPVKGRAGVPVKRYPAPWSR